MRILEISNFGREQLAEMLCDLGAKTAVEVGVAAGEYSEVLCRANPQMKVYGVDPWLPYKGYKDYVRKSTFNQLRAKALERLAPYPNWQAIEQMSDMAARRFKPHSLDFVYIDANHAEPWISLDLRTWWPKLRDGGIMAGHDYVRTADYPNDTVEAVHAFAGELGLVLFALGTKAINPGEVRDRPRSWMLIK